MATFLPSRGSPPLHGHFLNHQFQEDEECFLKCSGLGESESWGPETGVATPSSFKTFPSLIPGPDSVDICAIARPGGNQIIFKPEIIFFIIVTDSIFFLFCVTRCVCTYNIYIYIINIKEIIYLSWDGKMREGYIYGGGSYSSHSSDQQEKRGDVSLFPVVPSHLLQLLRK